MKVRRVDCHVAHSRISLPYSEISGFLAKLLYAVAYVPPMAHTSVHGGSLPLSEVRSRMGIGECPYFFPLPSPASSVSPLTSSLSSWRPSARLTTERYVNEQVPQFPAEHRELYQIAAPVIKRGGFRKLRRFRKIARAEQTTK